MKREAHAKARRLSAQGPAAINGVTRLSTPHSYHTVDGVCCRWRL